jgi:citrate synthase
MTYDPAFQNTASCKSAITFIDGDKGILDYRGYPIEQLAEQSTLPRGRVPAADGELPTKAQTTTWVARSRMHTIRPREHQAFMERLPLRRAPDGHAGLDGRRAVVVLPRGQGGQRRASAPLADHPPHRQGADHRRVAYRHRKGLPFVYPTTSSATPATSCR